MATSKDQTTKTETTAKGPAAAKKTTAKAEEASYAEQAAVLADDTRALAESIRADLGKLRQRCVDDFRDIAPEPTDAPAADGVRRIPMGIDEVTRALDGLAVTAADLTRQASL